MATQRTVWSSGSPLVDRQPLDNHVTKHVTYVEGKKTNNVHWRNVARLQIRTLHDCKSGLCTTAKLRENKTTLCTPTMHFRSFHSAPQRDLQGHRQAVLLAEPRQDRRHWTMPDCYSNKLLVKWSDVLYSCDYASSCWIILMDEIMIVLSRDSNHILIIVMLISKSYIDNRDVNQ